jgi:NADP-dependent 3-hydroxy acid dehydrogenase YdfG
MAEEPLEGQVVLATGAAKRIGTSIALRFAADAADVVINYLVLTREADALLLRARVLLVCCAAIRPEMWAEFRERNTSFFENRLESSQIKASPSDLR